MSTTNLSSARDLDGGATAAAAPDARDLNRRGIARLTVGDVAGALANFHRAGYLAPDYPEAWNNSGLVLHMLGQARAAVADFDRALAARPDYPEALTNRGRARQALGDGAGARADFDRALRCANGPFAASVLHNRGLLRQDQGDLTGALEDFDRALASDPRHTATLVSRGLARKEAGNLDGAVADFDRALEQSPAHGQATIYHGRGGVRVLQNDFAGAVADYDRALSLDPEKCHYYISRANARYHRRDSRAVADFRMAFRLDPEAAARELLRILTTDVQRQAEAVLANCARHLRLDDRDVVAHARRGLTLLLLGRADEAAPDLARVRELAPDMFVYLRRLIDRAQGLRGGPAPASPAPPTPSVIDAVFAGNAWEE